MVILQLKSQSALVFSKGTNNCVEDLYFCVAYLANSHSVVHNVYSEPTRDSDIDDSSFNITVATFCCFIALSILMMQSLISWWSQWYVLAIFHSMPCNEVWSRSCQCIMQLGLSPFATVTSEHSLKTFFTSHRTFCYSGFLDCTAWVGS